MERAERRAALKAAAVAAARSWEWEIRRWMAERRSCILRSRSTAGSAAMVVVVGLRGEEEIGRQAEWPFKIISRLGSAPSGGSLHRTQPVSWAGLT
jgi:hypothetical protein